ncbi:hypothetical protein SPRG_08058 [Saprolegnia parasitica CBS 223.65]|uniref:Uncharacterized protein n=1 Tax=Saprolegnia parasitica (strain CBS 223.65) TaxID=695850 RepID=A0A067CJQ4_SAPPC|nr:hypothetical protein SPRG_08058 [Saprolegnia parasitica CBS 223.65]KDO26756.1 hypothetical protein SPRG_08058 [Saprolegnia parasitica CBS 223.65]|eukprot:XP_012202420.1 hypothetical protein SPRG_08058 [Saprolegnia parasitica CBS 223.65]
MRERHGPQSEWPEKVASAALQALEGTWSLLRTFSRECDKEQFGSLLKEQLKAAVNARKKRRSDVDAASHQAPKMAKLAAADEDGTTLSRELVAAVDSAVTSAVGGLETKVLARLQEQDVRLSAIEDSIDTLRRMQHNEFRSLRQGQLSLAQHVTTDHTES